MTDSVQNPRRAPGAAFSATHGWVWKRPMVDAVIIEGGRHERNYWRDVAARYLELHGFAAGERK
jgi:hypothetical protein